MLYGTKCIEKDTKKFLDELREVNNFYKYFFPADLFLKVERIIPLLVPLSTISNFLEMKMMPKCYDPPIFKIPVEDFIEMIKLKDIIELLDEIIKLIESNSDITITQKTIDDFNNRNTLPIIGDSRDYCEI